MMEYGAIMCQSPLFRGVSETELQTMLGCLSARIGRIGRGGVILHAGRPVRELGLLLEGSALVAQEDFWGNRNLMDHLKPGDMFAEAFACVPGRAADVTVEVETDCTVLFLDAGRILTVCTGSCEHHNRIIRNLAAALAEKTLRSHEKLVHMSQRTTREKLLSYLSSQAAKCGRREFDIPFSRQQLADYLSVDRSGLSQQLCSLRDEGILQFHKNHFILL